MKTSTLLRVTYLGSLLFVLPLIGKAQSVPVFPSGGEILEAGSSNTLTWNPRLVDGSVSVSLWDGSKGKWSTICSNVSSQAGKITWAIPSNLEGNKFRVKLTTTGTMTGSTLTPSFFSVKQPVSSVQVESAKSLPNGIVATVHPNPATSIAHICIEELPDGVPAVVDVVSANGEKVITLYDATPSGDIGLCLTLDCSKLPSGTYYAQFQNAAMRRAVKFEVIK